MREFITGKKSKFENINGFDLEEAGKMEAASGISSVTLV